MVTVEGTFFSHFRRSIFILPEITLGYYKIVNPNVAYLCRGKTRKSTADVATHRLKQVEAYLTVREVLFGARSQMACYRASAAVFAGVDMQH
jgi:hypothetical protein